MTTVKSHGQKYVNESAMFLFLIQCGSFIGEFWMNNVMSVINIFVTSYGQLLFH